MLRCGGGHAEGLRIGMRCHDNGAGIRDRRAKGQAGLAGRVGQGACIRVATAPDGGLRVRSAVSMDESVVLRLPGDPVMPAGHPPHHGHASTARSRYIG